MLFRSAIVVSCVTALCAGGLISKTLATEPPAAPPDKQGGTQANRTDPDKRLEEIREQFLRLQTEIAQLEQESQRRRSENKTPDTSFLADLFKHRLPFETGHTESRDGGRIEIKEVWGTRPLIEIGGQYLVRGKYVLPPGTRGKLYFYATAEGDRKSVV